jgi:S-(hydroxymethyl)glutathione dehydrogenase/alcohol dehydrogenase
MSALQGARIQGAKTIIGIDPIKARRDLAMKVGATTVVDPNAEGQNLVPKLRTLTPDVVPPGRFFTGQRAAGPTYVIEAVGVTRFALPAGVEAPTDMTGVRALNDCYNVVRGGGILRTCGVYGGGGGAAAPMVSFPAGGWANSSKTHVPGNYAGVQALRDIPRFVRLIEKGLFDAKSMVGQTFSGDKMRDALQVAADRSKITSVALFDA